MYNIFDSCQLSTNNLTKANKTVKRRLQLNCAFVQPNLETMDSKQLPVPSNKRNLNYIAVKGVIVLYFIPYLKKVKSYQELVTAVNFC